MSTAEIFTVIVALLALLVNVVFVTFQVTWTLAKDQKDKKKKEPPCAYQTPAVTFLFRTLIAGKVAAVCGQHLFY